MHRINKPADDVPTSQREWIAECWESASALQGTEQTDSVVLVIDEIQKIKGWSEVVKKKWDEDTLNNMPIKVLPLGSSRVLLERGLADSLAGRFETIKVPHWLYGEMHDAFRFTLEQYILWQLSCCSRIDK